jgi:hypothetical protein
MDKGLNGLPYHHRFSLVACARWEESDIVEWIEYHRSVGFDHFYIYSNDDSPDTLYKVLQPYLLGDKPLVTYCFWPAVGQQMEMYADFLSNFKDETEWACFLDIDEFLVFKELNNVKAFMAGFESIADCVYFNWLNFGNNDKKQRDAKSVLSTLIRRSPEPDVHTKTLFRTSCITAEIAREGASTTGLPYTHFWTNYPIPEFRSVDVLKRDASDYAEDFPTKAHKRLTEADAGQRMIGCSFVAHFMIKSEEDFLRRAARGGFSAQSMWKERYERNEHLPILAGLNAVEDIYLKNYWDNYTAHAIRFPLGPIERDE